MTIPHPVHVLLWFLGWVAILGTLALYGTVWLVASALRLILGPR